MATVSSQTRIPRSMSSPGSGSGLPGIKSLRSLLPFGPNKQATAISASVSPGAKSSSPFSGFSVRKSRDRNASLSVILPPVIAIEKNEPVIRKSLSFNAVEKPLPAIEPEESEDISPTYSSYYLLLYSTNAPPSLARLAISCRRPIDHYRSRYVGYIQISSL